MDAYLQLFSSIPPDRLTAISTFLYAIGTLVSALALVGSVFVACMAVYITKKQRDLAEQQYKIQLHQVGLEDLQLKHELYERRIEVYRTLKGFLANVMCNANIDSES